MAEPKRPPPVLLVVAAFSGHADALAWGRDWLEGEFGPVALASPAFVFDQTAYYAPSMGSPLTKVLWAFADLVGADRLAAIKERTNALEKELAGAGAYPVARPLNLDPGYLALGKFVLATTKDQAHRVYLGEGIFAEVTLRYADGAYTPWPWTYADYRQPEVLAWLSEARAYYRGALRAGGGGLMADEDVR